MRRRRKDADGIPAHLAQFREADWPGASWRAKYDAWVEAQETYAAVNPWPNGPLDRLFRRMFVRDRHERRPLHLGVSDYFGLPPERARGRLDKFKG